MNLCVYHLKLNYNINFIRLLASENSSPDIVFSSVFMIFWLGATIISFNGKLLGG